MSAPNPKCELCAGTGAVPAEYKPPHPPQFQRCECVLRLDILDNTERGLIGLSRVPAIPTTPLLDREGKNLWITAGESFLPHLRHVAIRKPITWGLRVYSDAEMVTAWLATIAVNGQEIFDADAYTVSTKFMTLPDMVVPPDLLVVRMGVKVARNAAANEVLMEALQLRMHASKPTWIWDEPHNPLGPGHLFWSDSISRILPHWERIQNLSSPPETPGKRAILPREQTATPKRVTLRRPSLPPEVLAPDLKVEEVPEPEPPNNPEGSQKKSSGNKKSLRSSE